MSAGPIQSPSKHLSQAFLFYYFLILCITILFYLLYKLFIILFYFIYYLLYNITKIKKLQIFAVLCYKHRHYLAMYYW